MENYKNVLQDIEELKKCTQNLGNEINRAGINWKDKKFQELTKSIKKIAEGTRELIDVGEECSKNIKVFESYNQ